VDEDDDNGLNEARFTFSHKGGTHNSSGNEKGAKSSSSSSMHDTENNERKSEGTSGSELHAEHSTGKKAECQHTIDLSHPPHENGNRDAKTRPKVPMVPKTDSKGENAASLTVSSEEASLGDPVSQDHKGNLARLDKEKIDLEAKQNKERQRNSGEDLPKEEKISEAAATSQEGRRAVKSEFQKGRSAEFQIHPVQRSSGPDKAHIADNPLSNVASPPRSHQNDRKQQIYDYLKTISHLEDTVRAQRTQIEVLMEENSSLKATDYGLEEDHPEDTLTSSVRHHRTSSAPSTMRLIDRENKQKEKHEVINWLSARRANDLEVKLSSNELEAGSEKRLEVFATEISPLQTQLKTNNTHKKQAQQIANINQADAKVPKSIVTAAKLEAKVLRFEARSRDLDAEIHEKEEEKSRLVTELMSMRQRAKEMQKNYEVKIKELEGAIHVVQLEHDRTLRELSKKDGRIEEEKAKIEKAYEKKLRGMKEDLAQLNKTKREHAKLIKHRTKDEMKIRQLEMDISNAKQVRLDLKRKVIESRNEQTKLQREKVKQQRQITKLTHAKDRHLASLERKIHHQKVALQRRVTENNILMGKLKHYTRGKSKFNLTCVSPSTRTKIEDEIKAACALERLRSRLAEVIKRRDDTICKLQMLKMQFPPENPKSDVDQSLDSLEERRDYCTRLVIDLQKQITRATNVKGCLDLSLFHRIPHLTSQHQLPQAILFLLKRIVRISTHLTLLNEGSQNDPDATPRVSRSSKCRSTGKSNRVGKPDNETTDSSTTTCNAKPMSESNFSNSSQGDAKPAAEFTFSKAEKVNEIPFSRDESALRVDKHLQPVFVQKKIVPQKVDGRSTTSAVSVRRKPLPDVTPPRKVVVGASSVDPKKRVQAELCRLRADPEERAKLMERIRKMKALKEKERREFDKRGKLRGRASHSGKKQSFEKP